MLKQNKILIVVILVGLVAALGLVAGRFRSEAHNRRVEMVVDWDQIRGIALSSGRTPSELLRDFREIGVYSVAVSEQTIAELRDDGLIEVHCEQGMTDLITKDRELRHRIERYLSAKYPAPALFNKAPLNTYTIATPYEQIKDTGVGLPEADVRMLQSPPYSMEVIARLTNFPASKAGPIDRDLDTVAQMGIKKVIFAGDQVLGFSGLTDATAESLKRYGLIYGAVEFGKQKGDEKLSAKLRGQNMVRVHSIGAAEIWQLEPGSAVERYVRAARERNIRLLYIRFFDAANDDPVKFDIEYLSEIRDGLHGSGIDTGSSHPFEAPARPLALVILVGFGAVAGAVLLLATVLPVSTKLKTLLTVIGCLFAVALAAKGGDMGAKLLALLAALVFPTLSLTLFPIVPCATERPLRVRTGLAAIPAFIGICAITLVGAAMVAGLLAELPFMLRVNQFLGIKAAHLLPVLALFAIYVGDAFNRGEKWPDYKARVRDSFARFFSQPMVIWQLLILGGIFVVLGLMVLRTGNDAGIGVSSLEIKFRAILDRIMLVRPRTKEFAFGHPALLLGLALALAGRRRFAIPFVVAGSVGQVSLLNTFCHIHTPLALSALRASNGIVAGMVVALVLIWVAGIVFPGIKAEEGAAVSETTTGTRKDV